VIDSNIRKLMQRRSMSHARSTRAAELPNPPASTTDTIVSLTLLLDEPHHDPRYHDDQQDRHQYPAVSTHPAVSAHPAAAIHHGSVLRQSNTGGQQGYRTNNHSRQSLHMSSSSEAMTRADQPDESRSTVKGR